MEKKKLRSILLVAFAFLFCTVLPACSPRAGTASPANMDAELMGGEFIWASDSD